MKVVSPNEDYEKKPYETACFMAGGCANTEWQADFIHTLECCNPSNLVIYSPYNPEIKDTFLRMEWEYKYLHKYINDNFIFSVYFDRYTKQPMSMFELGVMSHLSKPRKFELITKRGKTSVYDSLGFPCVVSAHPEAPCLEDIKCQMKLYQMDFGIRTPKEHAREVYKVYRNYKECQI